MKFVEVFINQNDKKIINLDQIAEIERLDETCCCVAFSNGMSFKVYTSYDMMRSLLMVTTINKTTSNGWD